MAKDHKLLHVKIEQGDRVLHRKIGKNERFSMGQDPRCDVTLYGSQFPKRHFLFSGKNNHFEINLTDYMQGEVVAGESRLTFQDMIAHGLLARKGGSFYYSVTSGKKGRLRVGDAQITFQCSSGAPPVQEEKFLAFSWGYATLRDLGKDLSFKAILVVTFAVHMLLLAYLKGLPTDSINAPGTRRVVPERLARLIIRKPEPVVPPPEKAIVNNTESEEEAPEDKPDEARPKKAKEAAPPESQGVLGLLTGIGGSDESGDLSGFLLDKGLVKELDQVMANTDLSVGQGNGSSAFDDLIAATDLAGGIDDLLATSDNNIEGVSLGRKARIDVEQIGRMSGSDAAVGQRSEESVRQVLLANTGRLTYMYKKYLRRNPDLRGKMVVEVVIAASGRVSKATLLSSTLNFQQLEREIMSFVRTWRYPEIDQGDVSVTLPLFFSRVD